jgi:diguanylate cyclase (GGDEF)-like protein
MTTDTHHQQAFIELQQENQQLKAQVLELESELRRLNAAAGKSDLPSVLSRPEFIREVARMMAHDQRYGATSSLISFSFDGLDDCLKTLGHAEHDRIFTTLADTLVHNVRACDIVGRTGVEDFGIFLTRCKEPDARVKAGVMITRLKERLDPLLKGKGTFSLRHAIKALHDKADLEKIRR